MSKASKRYPRYPNGTKRSKVSKRYLKVWGSQEVSKGTTYTKRYLKVQTFFGGQTDTQTHRQTHLYNDSAWPRGQAEWKQVIFDRKLFKLQRYSSITLRVSPKKNKFQSRKRRWIPQNFQAISQNIFLGDLFLKQLNLLVFKRMLWKICSKYFFRRNVGFDLKRQQTF